MAQKYYNVKEAAQILGKTEDDVRQMLEHRQLHGYRDGADWKFKAEEIERVAGELKAQAVTAPEESDQVLLSEVELGQSGIGTSGTVIGMEEAPRRAESDIKLGESKIDLDAKSATPPIGKAQVDSRAAKFEELDLALEEDLTLAESDIGLDANKKPTSDSPTDVSSVKIGTKPLDDDDVVLGGGSSASGITLSGDSGISLVDPADSGLSLESPMELGPGASGQSLELGDEDTLQLVESSKSGPALKADDDFLLTPMEETPEAEDSETGSQVIALDSESDEAATMVAREQGMGAMLDEGVGVGPAFDLETGVSLGPSSSRVHGLGMTAGALAEGAAIAPSALAEAPYTVWNIVFLSLCVFFLLFCGAMIYDLLRNMWSWESAGSVNTWLMDTIIGLFEK